MSGIKINLRAKLKKLAKIAAYLTAAFLLWGLIASAQKYHYPDRAELDKKTNYLERVVTEPFDDGYDLELLRAQNTEWALFTLSYTTYALTNISYLDSTYKPDALRIIDKAIQKGLDSKIHGRFPKTDPSRPELDMHGSVLYLGHLNLMMGCYRKLGGDNKYDTINDRISKALFERYERATYKCLQSYPDMIWIPDNTVAIASLKLHSENTGSTYDTMCSVWLNYTKEHYLDSETELLCSTINTHDGTIKEEPRGSMLGWSIFFIYRFDPEFAKKQYTIYKKKFSNNLLVIRLYRERYRNYMTGLGDIDSGPLFLGYSIPASAFAFGDAVAMKDLRNAKRLKRLINFGSKTIEEDNEIKYKIRFTELSSSPMQEALILYLETMTEWN